MNPPPDKQREIVRTWLEPLGDGLSKKTVSVAAHERFRESITTPPGDDIDELVADLRRIETEHPNNPRRL
jgi:hypothetical protein